LAGETNSSDHSLTPSDPFLHGRTKRVRALRVQFRFFRFCRKIAITLIFPWAGNLSVTACFHQQSELVQERPAKLFRTKRVRKQKTDRQDAQLILRLLLEDRFPEI
jgi:hypothetical protein